MFFVSEASEKKVFGHRLDREKPNVFVCVCVSEGIFFRSKSFIWCLYFSPLSFPSPLHPRSV